jgi:hypothetical protein
MYSPWTLGESAGSALDRHQAAATAPAEMSRPRRGVMRINTAGTRLSTLHRNMATKKFPIRPLHPERLCWGCDRYCAADSLICGNGTERTQHPVEVFGEDGQSWGLDAEPEQKEQRATLSRAG